jgi:hypothetical protein
MQQQETETIERLVRVRASRRGKPVELRVHYGRETASGCEVYRIFKVEDTEDSTGTVASFVFYHYY